MSNEKQEVKQPKVKMPKWLRGEEKNPKQTLEEKIALVKKFKQIFWS